MSNETNTIAPIVIGANVYTVAAGRIRGKKKVLVNMEEKTVRVSPNVATDALPHLLDLARRQIIAWSTPAAEKMNLTKDERARLDADFRAAMGVVGDEFVRARYGFSGGRRFAGPCRCPHCRRPFKNGSNLRVHLERFHRENLDTGREIGLPLFDDAD